LKAHIDVTSIAQPRGAIAKARHLFPRLIHVTIRDRLANIIELSEAPNF
jgi:hypothetical protein